MSFAPLPNRTKLGLGDPRVIKCFDRGDEFYSHANHPQRSSSVDIASSSPRSPQIVQHVREKLEDAIKKYPADSITRIFIPRDLLSSLMTFDTVYSVMNTLSCCSNLSPADKKALAQEVCSGDGPRCRRPCRKLLAVLIGIELQDDLIKLIEDGIDDNCLPLQLVPDIDDTLKCGDPNHNHQVINEYGKMRRLWFCQWTYAVMAPYFMKPPNRHVHYVLDHNDVLPILQLKDQEPSEAPDVMQPKSKNPETSECMSTYGGFSRVQRVQFHPSHYHFGPEDRLNGEMLFALKKLNSTKVDDFNKELASLLSFQNGDYKHLIKLLATFEIKGAQGTDSSEFYLVFPWAQGNLWHFWKVHQDPIQRNPRCLWMAEQCHQLAIALQHVHNEREVHLRNLPDVDENNHDLYGRHGDVKAENTLWFKGDDILVMTDFGLGRLHSKISASNDTKSLERTATYRAPEFDTKDGRISRACDIYSMGCMFLEFITWHLGGWESVHDDFPKYRLEWDHYKFLSDTFFQIEENSGEPKTAIMKPKVTAWIRQLRRNPDCTQYHMDFLRLIEDHMLEPNAQKRIKSPELERKLDLFVRTCRIDSSYYKDLASPSMNPD